MDDFFFLNSQREKKWGYVSFTSHLTSISLLRCLSVQDYIHISAPALCEWHDYRRIFLLISKWKIKSVWPPHVFNQRQQKGRQKRAPDLSCSRPRFSSCTLFLGLFHYMFWCFNLGWVNNILCHLKKDWWRKKTLSFVESAYLWHPSVQAQ